MKKILALCGVLLALSTSAAFAAGGLDLTWKDCVLETTQQDINFTNCTTTPATNATIRMYSVMKVPNPIPLFVAAQLTYDMQEGNGTAPLTNFWRFSTSPCNGSLQMQIDSDPAGGGVICALEGQPWGSAGGEATANILGFQADTPANGRGRLILAINRASTDPFPLDVGVNYYICTLLFNTTQRAACPGCNSQAIWVWNDAELADNLGNRTNIGNPDKLGNCVQFNHAPAANCIVTPTRKTTWGQLKSIYR